MLVILIILGVSFVIGVLCLLYLESKILCNHSYKKIDSYIISSDFERIKELGMIPNTHTSMTRKYVSEFKCNNCGNIHTTVTKS